MVAEKHTVLQSDHFIQIQALTVINQGILGKVLSLVGILNVVTAYSHEHVWRVEGDKERIHLPSSTRGPW